MIAVGRYGGEVEVLDTANGHTIGSLGHQNTVHALTFSHNGLWLASGNNDGEVRVWDLKSGKTFAKFSAHNDWVRDLAFSSNDRMLASAGGDNVVRIWDMDKSALLKELNGHENWVYKVVYAGEGHVLLSGDRAGRVIAHNLDTGDRSWVAEFGAPIGALSLNPTDPDIAVVVAESKVYQLRLKDGTFEASYQSRSGLKAFTSVAGGDAGALVNGSHVVVLESGTGAVRARVKSSIENPVGVFLAVDRLLVVSPAEAASILVDEHLVARLRTQELQNLPASITQLNQRTQRFQQDLSDAAREADMLVSELLWDTQDRPDARNHVEPIVKRVRQTLEEVHVIVGAAANLQERLSELENVASVTPLKRRQGLLPEFSLLEIEFLELESAERWADLQSEIRLAQRLATSADRHHTLSENVVPMASNSLDEDSDGCCRRDSRISLSRKGTLLTRMAVNFAGGGSAPTPTPSVSPVPLNTTASDLPHDGLFTRRNNFFGTRLSAGIRDLIDQGRIPEQLQIRFDDFIASRADGIALPQSGRALAVSHGVAEIPLHQRRHREATHYLEIALRTAENSPLGHPQASRPDVGFVFVVDKSGSMGREQKLETVKDSIEQLVGDLESNDRLGVIAFDNSPRTLLGMTYSDWRS
jgi:hypothetical protein